MPGNEHSQLHERVDKLRTRIVEGSILRAIIILAGPAVASRLLNVAYELIDTIFLGHLGEAELAAPTAAWPLLMLFMSIAIGISSSSVSMVSQLVGARDYEKASDVSSQLLGLTLLVGVLSAFLYAGISPVIYSAQSLSPEVYKLALIYTLYLAIGVPTFFAVIYYTNLLNSLGDTRTPFILNTVSVTINIVLDPLLIFGLLGFPRWGVMGAAVATSIARIVAGIYALYHLSSGRIGFRVTPRIPTLPVTRVALKVGLPVSFQMSLTSIGFLVMIKIVALLGTAVLASYNVAVRILGLIQAFAFGFSQALGVVVGQNIGAGHTSRAWESAKKGLLLLFGLMGIGSLLIYLGNRPIVEVFTTSGDVIRESIIMINIIAVGTPFLGVMFASNGIARGSGHTRIVALIGAARLWVFRIPLAYYLAFTVGLGPKGVWWAMTLSNILSGLAAVAWVIRRSWLKGLTEEPIYAGQTQNR
ncbi:MAG: MATE family efflux transporter [Desulfurococcales archaeon]|nr:MATE family efflux transporter [Desulfurococcales archaeon]